MIILYLNYHFLKKYEFIEEKLVIERNKMELSHYNSGEKIWSEEILFEDLEEISCRDIFWNKYKKSWSIRKTVDNQKAIIIKTLKNNYYFGYKISFEKAKKIIDLLIEITQTNDFSNINEKILEIKKI